MKKLLLLSLLGISSMAMSMDLSSLVGQCAAVGKRLIITDNGTARIINVTSVNPFKKNRDDRATITIAETDDTGSLKFVAQVLLVNGNDNMRCCTIKKILEVVQE